MVAVESTMLPLGTPLPDLAPLDVPDTSDAPALLVAFVCNHCPYVQHVAPEFGRLAREWGERGLAVLAINPNDVEAYPDDGPEYMVAFAAKHGWEFPYVLDATQEVARRFHAACTPDFFLFDGEHRLAYRGRLDASRPNSGVPVTGDELGPAVVAVLAGESAPAEQFPSIGCNIKWKPGNEPT